MDLHHQDNPLGKKVSVSASYDKNLLFPIPRSAARKELSPDQTLRFFGEDIWNCYEISWLTEGGVPRMAIGSFRVPADSTNIVESKSVKLYLNSFNQTRFASLTRVLETIQRDLSAAVDGKVEVQIFTPAEFKHLKLDQPEGVCIDESLTTTDQYQVDPTLLKTGTGEVSETLYSHLLRTRCPVTDQPDWATVFISYSGPRLLPEALLAYLVSFREHNGFHENCVERIFTDIMEQCRPQRLKVEARFTRRGGIDINPVRANYPVTGTNRRMANQ